MEECPVCYEILQPPIFVCCNGHPVCPYCLARILSSPVLPHQCPVCRDRMTRRRHRDKEKQFRISQATCRYYHQGCPETGLGAAILQHQIVCQFAPPRKILPARIYAPTRGALDGFVRNFLTITATFTTLYLLFNQLFWYVIYVASDLIGQAFPALCYVVLFVIVFFVDEE